MTKPTTKSGTNHAIGSATLPSTRSFPLMAAPVITATAVSPICAKARIVHAMTLPNMSTRAEVDASRISTIRDCFSSTTEDAIVFPNVMAAMKNTSPSPRPMKEVSVGSGASGSRCSTSRGRLSEAMSDSGAERRESTARPGGEDGDTTTAAPTTSAVHTTHGTIDHLRGDQGPRLVRIVDVDGFDVIDAGHGLRRRRGDRHPVRGREQGRQRPRDPDEHTEDDDGEDRRDHEGLGLEADHDLAFDDQAHGGGEPGPVRDCPAHDCVTSWKRRLSATVCGAKDKTVETVSARRRTASAAVGSGAVKRTQLPSSSTTETSGISRTQPRSESVCRVHSGRLRCRRSS